MREISFVPIFDRAAGRYVEAEFIDGVTWDEIAETQARWSVAMQDLVARLAAANVPGEKWPEHAHWDWRIKYWIGEAEGHRRFGIRLGYKMQGLMLVVPSAESKLVAGQKAVYIDYIATAPWNERYEGAQDGQFAQVGSVLIQQAVDLSRKYGFSGRIGLYALPQAVEWYIKLGMTEVRASLKDGLRYFEMTPEAARQFVPEE
jgi:hypothetical protein